MTYEFHPLANIFPFMDKSAFSDLVDDVEKNGVHEPIWLFDGQIIDGRHRYKAAQQVGVACPTREYVGKDPVSFVLSLNLNRRHLNESQRGMVAANLANMPEGRPETTARIQAVRPETTAQICAVSQSDAAEKLNVSRRTVQQAVKLSKTAAPELVEQVAQGNVSIHAASKVANLPTEEQKEIVKGGAQAIKDAARPVQIPKVVDVTTDELEALREQIIELQANLKETLSDNEMMGRVFDADDRIQAAMNEAKRQKAIADNAERTLAAKNGEYVERARAVTMWKGRAERAEKELAKMKLAA